jgi:hypothetical protein
MPLRERTADGGSLGDARLGLVTVGRTDGMLPPKGSVARLVAGRHALHLPSTCAPLSARPEPALGWRSNWSLTCWPIGRPAGGSEHWSLGPWTRRRARALSGIVICSRVPELPVTGRLSEGAGAAGRDGP